MTCQCARVVRLVSIVARYARRETDDGFATRSRSRVGVNRVKLPPSARARARGKEADSETQLVGGYAGGEVRCTGRTARGSLGSGRT